MSTTTTEPTFFEKLQAFLAREATVAQRVALHLLGLAAADEASINNAVQASPLAQDAITLAEAHGVPVHELAGDAEAVIAEGQKLANALASGPSTPAAPAAS